MFTGIVTDIGTVQQVEQRGDTRFVIGTRYDPASIAIGASIACAGVCLTVTDRGTGSEGGGWFAVDASAETLSLTTAQSWAEGTHLNLERALKIGDELGGHIVTGHVDGLGKVVSAAQDGDSWRLAFAAPAELAPFIARKGSITIDGVSLTVNTAERAEFSVNIIPHTQSVTSLGNLAPGHSVNLEIDVLARYVARLESARKGG